MARTVHASQAQLLLGVQQQQSTTPLPLRIHSNQSSAAAAECTRPPRGQCATCNSSGSSRSPIMPAGIMPGTIMPGSMPAPSMLPAAAAIMSLPPCGSSRRPPRPPRPPPPRPPP